MSNKYILDGHTPVRCDDVVKWAMWFETADRRVARDEINGAVVSTVFLGLDHNWGEGPPHLFETMIFGYEESNFEWQRRCSTWEEAEELHEAACRIVRKAA